MLLLQNNKERIDEIPENAIIHVSEWKHYFKNYLNALNVIVENETND